MAIAGRGSGLMAAARTATVTRADIERVLLSGFFPDCGKDARPVSDPERLAGVGPALRHRHRRDAPSGRLPARSPARRRRPVQRRLRHATGAAPADLRDRSARGRTARDRWNLRTPNRRSPWPAGPRGSAHCCTARQPTSPPAQLEPCFWRSKPGRQVSGSRRTPRWSACCRAARRPRWPSISRSRGWRSVPASRCSSARFPPRGTAAPRQATY